MIRKKEWGAPVSQSNDERFHSMWHKNTMYMSYPIIGITLLGCVVASKWKPGCYAILYVYICFHSRHRVQMDPKSAQRSNLYWGSVGTADDSEQRLQQQCEQSLLEKKIFVFH